MEFTFSQHALSRCIDMALDVDEIVMCLNAPERTVPDKFKACVYYVRGDIACVVDFKDKHVVTVVWRRDDRIDESAPQTERFNREGDQSWLMRRSRTSGNTSE